MVDDPPPDEVQALAAQRQAARGRGDFAAADEFRSQIEQAGWQVRDTAGGYAVYRRA
jgi:cysteinyl-tRNA synthetase